MEGGNTKEVSLLERRRRKRVGSRQTTQESVEVNREKEDLVVIMVEEGKVLYFPQNDT